jgi:GAF domain-containing protein
MSDPVDPLRDAARVAAVRRIHSLSTAGVDALRRFAEMATVLLDSPLGLVTLLDEVDHHLVAAAGRTDWVVRGPVMPAADNYCPHVIARDGVLTIDDARTDPAFSTLAACVEGEFVAYAGAPLRGPTGHAVGTVCVLDKRRRRWTAAQRRALEQIALAAGATLSLLADPSRRDALLSALDHAPIPVAVLRGTDHLVEYANEECRASLGPMPPGVPVATALPALASRGLIEVLDRVRTTGVTHHSRRSHAPGRPGRVYATTYSLIGSGPEAGVLAVGTDITDSIAMRRSLEQHAAREQSVARAAEAIVRGDEPHARLEALAASVVPALADACSVYVLTPPRPVGSAAPLDTVRLTTQMVAGATGAPAGPIRWDGADPVSEAVRTGGLVATPFTPDAPPPWVTTAQVRDVGRTRRVQAVVTVPVTVNAQVTAVVSFVAFAGRRPYTTDDHDALRRIAAEAGYMLGHDAAHLRTREIALALQRSLLTALPTVDGCAIAAHYRPAGEGAEVGGDWYDAFVLPRGGLGLAVGDVVGHDVHGAAAMGQLRSMLRALAHGTGATPAVTLDELAALTVRLGVTRFATAVHGVLQLDPPARFTWASAGHPPPVVIDPLGVARPLRTPPGPPLGVRGRHVRATESVDLAPGSTLLLYTDGLVERRDRDIDEGLAEMCRRASARYRPDLQELCDELAGAAATDDDVALLAIRIDTTHMR